MIKITAGQMRLVRKALVALTIEQVLLEIGGPSLLYKVHRILYEKCRSYLPDCFDNPGNFGIVCRELDEGTCNVIVDLIKERLEEFSYQKPIGNFLASLCQIKCIQR